MKKCMGWRRHSLVNFVHAGLAAIGREAHVAVLGASQKYTEKLVQMGKQEAVPVSAI